MPTSRRTASTLWPPAVSSMPSTTILPFWIASSWLMQRISVDLPEPEGPQMTIRSPRADVEVDVPVSAWKLPYHLLTPSIRMAVSAGGLGGGCGRHLRDPQLAACDEVGQRRAEPLLVDLVELAVGLGLARRKR